MRYILIFWAIPMGLFWSWYGLSSNDISFGMLMFSRELHDQVFRLYSAVTGIAPEDLPGVVGRACVVDTVLIFGIFAFRRRKALAAWAGGLRTRYFGEGAAPSA